MSKRQLSAEITPALRITLTLMFLLAFAVEGTVIAQTLTQDGKILPATVSDRDFVAQPSLAADSTQAIIFKGDTANKLGRFDLKAGTHRFCVEGPAKSFRSIELVASDGLATDVPLDRTGCAQADLSQGIASVRLQPAAGPGLPGWTTVALRVYGPVAASPVPPVPLLDSNNSPVAGYWAIQDTTFNARGTFGNRMLSTLPGNGQDLILVDPSTSFDELSLWQLPPSNGSYPPYPPALLYSASNYWWFPLAGPYVTTQCSGFFDYCENAYGPPPNLQIKDAGNYQFTFLLNPPDINGSLYGSTQNGVTSLDVTLGGVPADTFQVLFRFFPDGLAQASLSDNEVAISQACNYQGRTSVFIPLLGAGVVSGAYDLNALSSSATTLNGTGKSVAIGKGSSIYWGSSATDLQGAVVSDASCLPSPPSGQLFVEPVSNALVVAHNLLNQSCVNCSLVGQTLQSTGATAGNFANWNFTGADFSHSVLTGVDLSGATLSGAKFIGATLTDVSLNSLQLSTPGLDFTGATLTRVTFNGNDISQFNFSNGTLTNVDLSSTRSPGGGLAFTGATMNQVNLSGVNPASITAVGATLCGVSLTGADTTHVLDLTSGNFANVTVSLNSGCAANLSFTNLNATVVPGNPWTGFTFTGTQINGLNGQVLSTQANPLDFTNVPITGMWLQNVVLDYAAGLAGRDLTGVRFSNSSLRFVNLSKTTLYGGQFVNSNLEGADMSGSVLTKPPGSSTLGAADFTGSFLRNVNLSYAQMSYATFSNANFYSQHAVGNQSCDWNEQLAATNQCATAKGAIMNGTVFGGAYLFGVDFTNTTAQGVNFTNAILVGANFDQATLIAGTEGTVSGFGGAFLQGTNMAQLTLQNGISLDGAFVDFRSQGNVLTLILGQAHTKFASYWGTPGEPVCAQLSYPGPTTVPSTNSSNTCPNGSSSQNGCGSSSTAQNSAWNNNTDITSIGSYQYQATFTKAYGTAVCAFDFAWIPISLDEPPPPPHPHPPHHPHPPRKPHRPRHPHHPQRDPHSPVNSAGADEAPEE